MQLNVNNIPKDREYEETKSDDESLWSVNNVHDPAIFKDGDWYYVFSTDAQVSGEFKPGIQVRKSRDLINWQWVGRAFSEVPKSAEKWTGAKGLWAPEVVKFGNTFFLYYAASQFGKTQSFIGVATSKNIEGPWEDQGEVFKTKQDEGPNAIDPNISFDENGDPWMVYGSFFGGIFVSKINPQTGKLSNYGKGKLIAKRHQSVEGAIEGPYIIYNEKHNYYYLFVSYDSLFTNYNIRVARSKNIDGPYLDFNGNDMTDTTLPPDDVGMKVLGGYKFNHAQGWKAPGHNSVLKDEGDYYVVHHVRRESDKGHYLHIRKIGWTLDGWPLVSPERFAGEQEIAIEQDEVVGHWELLYFDKDNNDQIKSRDVYLSIEDNQSKALLLEQTSDNHFKLSAQDHVTLDGLIIPAWDWEKWCETHVFMGKDSNGNVVTGKRVADKHE